MGGSSKKQTVGYKYYLGMHMILCHGPIDYLYRIYVDSKEAYNSKTSGGSISVNKPDLFGGEKREGGVVGTVDFEQGDDSQTANTYLQARLGTDIPAFRGVVGMVLRQVYLGVNPYLKRWAFRAQRVHTRQNGIAQWYDAKAGIRQVSTAQSEITWTSFAGSEWETNAPTKFQLLTGGAIANTLVNATNSDYYRTPAPNFEINRLYCEFTLVNRDQGDPLGIRFDSSTGADLFGFMPQAEDAFDALKRPHINYWTSPSPIYGSELSQGVLYSFEAIMDNDNLTFEYWLRQGTTILANGTAALPAGTPQYVTFGRTSNATPADTGISQFSRLTVSGAPLAEDMNPAHIIRECLTDPDWGMGYQDADIDDTSFMAAADTLYNEGMGISLLWDRQIAIEGFITEIVKHIDAALYVDRTTGKFVLKLIRADYNEASLPVFDESNIDKIEGLSRPTFGELTNSVTVNYWNSETGEDASLTVQDTALVQMQNAVINTTVQYPGFTNAALAGKVALRDLKTLSTPLWTCTLYTNQDAKDLTIGSAFKLSWADYGLSEVVMRVTGIAYGDGKSNKIRIQATQDQFATPTAGVIDVPSEDDGWTPLDTTPIPLDVRLVTESPYYELVVQQGQTDIDAELTNNADLGYLLVAGGRPAVEGAVNALVYVDNGSGYVDSDTMDYSPFAYCDGDYPAEEGPTVVTITDLEDLELIEVGQHVQWGTEICRVDAISSSSATLGRGVLDTVPVAHSDGELLLFWDNFPASDEVEYTASESVDVKLLTVTGEGTLAEVEAPVDSHTFASRAIRPYPPGNVQINSSYFPETIGGAAELTLTWVHRDRVQQTGSDLLDFTDASVGPEAGTTYEIDLYNEEDSLVRSVTGLTDLTYTYDADDEKDDSELPAGGTTGTYQDLITSAAPTAYWKLDDTSGTSMVDSIGGYNGTYFNSPSLNQTPIIGVGTSVSFNGSTQYTTVADNAALRPGTGEYCIEMWMSFTSTGLGMAFGKFDLSIPFRGPTVFCNYRNDTTTTGYIELRDQRTSGYWVDTLTSGLNDGTARHYVFQRRLVSTGPDVWKLEIYINGVLDNETTLPSVLDLNTTQTMYVCSRNSQYVGGNFDEVAYYVGKALTPAEVLSHYNARNGFSNTYRLNGILRAVLRSKRDGYNSFQSHDLTVKRTGYGFNYGEYYGGV